jgi:transketolase
VALAEHRPEIVGLTADLAKYTDLHLFAQAYPTLPPDGHGRAAADGGAGGMAKEGLIPFATTYAVSARAAPTTSSTR